jgi:hypothetical protein
MKYLGILAALTLAGAPATAYSRSIKRDENSGPLTRAKAAFERGDCVDTILEAAAIAAKPGSDGDIAKFYIAQCQEQLGDLALSYETAKKANPKGLSPDQRAELDDLLKRLSAPYSPKRWAVTGSAGVVIFKNDQYLKDGFFYDVVGSYLGDNTSITFDYEPSSIKLVDGSTYTQTQMVLVGEQRFLDSLGIKLGYRQQSASSSTYDGASNYLIGGRWFNSQSQIGATYAASQYPNYYPASLAVSQISAFGSTSFGDISGGPGLIGIDARVHSIKPQMTYSKKTYPTVAAFNDSYNSYELGLRYSLSPVSIAGAIWGGEQVFGVFSDMFAVWNNSTVHTGGRKISFDYYYQSTAALTLFYASDDLKNTASKAASSVSVFGINASYFF